MTTIRVSPYNQISNLFIIFCFKENTGYFLTHMNLICICTALGPTDYKNVNFILYQRKLGLKCVKQIEYLS